MNEYNEYLNQINAAKTKIDLYSVAGFLNNYPEHIDTDKVTFMGFLTFDEAKTYCLNLLNKINFN